jgi:hypothetical protein
VLVEVAKPQKKTPEVIQAIRKLMQHDTAGDPVHGLKWTRKTTEKIAGQLKELGIEVSANTVGKLLKDLGFSLRVNHKKRTNGVKNQQDRDQQFRYIAEMVDQFAAAGNPVVCVDTKKKEMVGQFRNPGQTWCEKAEEVNDHDFRSLASGMAVPYGVYDRLANRGSVFVGASSDTPQFAVDCLSLWYRYAGRYRYPRRRKLLIQADSGGSNSCAARLWKYALQKQLCDRYGLTITVCHFPAGASKWNPCDHRLFSQISKNWAGIPLDSYETVLNYIGTTKTSTGLQVNAYLVRKKYQTGIVTSDQQMSELHLTKHDLFPRWNYTLRPK